MTELTPCLDLGSWLSLLWLPRLGSGCCCCWRAGAPAAGQCWSQSWTTVRRWDHAVAAGQAAEANAHSRWAWDSQELQEEGAEHRRGRGSGPRQVGTVLDRNLCSHYMTITSPHRHHTMGEPWKVAQPTSGGRGHQAHKPKGLPNITPRGDQPEHPPPPRCYHLGLTNKLLLHCYVCCLRLIARVFTQ